MKFLSLLIMLVVGSFVAEAQDSSGLVVRYYDNGNKKSEGEYYQGYKIGLWQTWYENGILYSKENYTTDKEKIDVVKKDGMLSLGYDFVFSKYFAGSGGILEGKSEWFFPNGQLSAEEIWSKKAVSVKHWDENGKKKKVDVEVNEMPPGVMQNASFTGKLVNKTNHGEGRIVLQATLSESGEIENVLIASPSGSVDMDEMVLKMAKEKSNWISCRIHNLPARQILTLPIRF